ncbi:MAG TPA: hypothetical protein VNC15_05675 [Solirubrobacterales bacterium]|jgi:hypothetical protein|nr:hypothetical protein [Solirubrobacterales bacterium]
MRRAILLAGLLALGLATSASGVDSCIGPLCVSSTATIQPRELPRSGGAPITLSSITRVKTKDGSTPPTLAEISFLIDKHGRVNSKAFPTCPIAKLEGTTPAQARKRCATALVGKGTGKALVTMPGREPFTITSPISFFNAPPAGGKPTLIAHAYETVPSPQALLVPIVVRRVAKGRYGFQVDVKMPEIAGGFGAPTLAEAHVGATRERGGKKAGFVEAYCSGGRLQVEGDLTFTNGDFFPATLTSPCHLPR